MGKKNLLFIDQIFVVAIVFYFRLIIYELNHMISVILFEI